MRPRSGPAPRAPRRNTSYLDHALATLREQGYPVRDADAARLSVYQHSHLNVHGHYSFLLPDLAGGLRPLRNPDEAPHE
ncbi:transposase [Micromonospora sp. MW-13]|uniref:transposase n=1 Tax=Micromonospora sp. MW-13 TaxID=2094022 RepID=UPI001FB26DDE|nr:transposase [Micromonospora sp. MW-13]